MKDKVQKIRKELERLKEETSIGLSEYENGVEQGRMEIINALSILLDSMQEEPVSEEQVKESLISIHDDETCKEKSNSLTQEPTIPDIVDEHYWEMLGEEPVSEEFEKAANEIVNKAIPPLAVKYKDGTYVGKIMDCFDRKEFMDLVKAGAQWQKEQMMKDAVLCGVDGWFINNKRNCRKNGRFHKYYVSTITHDKPLPMKNGEGYRLIVIKED